MFPVEAIYSTTVADLNLLQHLGAASNDVSRFSKHVVIGINNPYSMVLLIETVLLVTLCIKVGLQ